MTASRVQIQPRIAGHARRFFRFSLRTLFVVMLVFAVWLGVTFHRVRQQRAAVARIGQLGGTVRYAHEMELSDRTIRNPALPARRWLRRLLGSEFFDTVVWINLDRTAATDDDLRLIGKIRGVVFMHLNWTNVSDAGVYELRHWRKLQYLGLSATKITSQSLRHLADLPELADLPLENTAVDDQGLAALSGHRKLALLSLGQTRVTSKGIECLRACTELTILSLRSTAVDDDAVQSFASLCSLDVLDVTDTKMTGQGLLSLREAMPHVQVEAHLVALNGNARRKITLSANRWPPVLTRILALDDEHRLKLLDFSWSNIQDEQVAALHGLKHVELIVLQGSDATEQGVAALRKDLPHCEVLY